MLLLNFIVPCSVNFVYGAVFSEEIFWPKNPAGGTGKVPPEDQDGKDGVETILEKLGRDDEISNWNYENWKITDDYIEALVSTNTTNAGNNADVDLSSNPIWEWITEYTADNDMDFDESSVRAAARKHNEILEEIYESNNGLKDEEKTTIGVALRKAIDAAVDTR